MGDTVILAIYFPLVMVGMVLVIMWGMSAAAGRIARDTAKVSASDFIHVKFDEGRDTRWCVVEKGRESTAEALRRRTVSFLNVSHRHCVLVHGARRAR